MSRIALIAAVAATVFTALALPARAVASEGQSRGHGIKCYWVMGADGMLHQVCRKGI